MHLEKLFFEDYRSWSTIYVLSRWHIYMCDVTRSHVWHDSFTSVIWLVHMCDMTRSHVWHDSFTSVTYDMSHSRVTWRWRDVFTCVTWLIHVCDMSHSHGLQVFLTIFKPHDPYALALPCESRHIHEWEMSHTHMTYVTFMHESCHTHTYNASTIHMPSPCHVSHVTEIYESCHIHTWVTSCTCMSHDPYALALPCESRHMHEWVVSHTHMSYVTFMHESCHTHTYIMPVRSICPRPAMWVTSHAW